MQFVVHERLEAESAFAQMAAHPEIDAATLDALAKEAGNFCAEVLHPLNKIGDCAGCRIGAPALAADDPGAMLHSRARRD